MFRDPTIAGSWPALIDRLETGDVVVRWAAQEPALSGVRAIADLPDLLAAGGDRLIADALLGALVRVAAADGGDDSDAVLLLVHLLSDGVIGIARRLEDLSVDILALVVGELTAQIRAFPWRRRTRAFAANLLLDTKGALLRELRPHRTRVNPGPVEIFVDPLDQWQVRELLDSVVSGPGESEAFGFWDFCTWAERAGVVTGAEVELLLDVARANEVRYGGRLAVASSWRISERTLRRRRDRTMRALRTASGAYLAECA